MAARCPCSKFTTGRLRLEALAPEALQFTARALDSHNPYAQALLALAPQLLQMTQGAPDPLAARTATIAIELMALALDSLNPHSADAPVAANRTDSHALSGPAALALWRRTRDLIWQHIGEPELSAAFVSQKANVSLRRLQEVFRAQGTTISDTIWAMRLDYAHSLLSNPIHTSHSITTLAYRAGFSDMAHFSRRFKQAFGVTPREFRGR